MACRFRQARGVFQNPRNKELIAGYKDRQDVVHLGQTAQQRGVQLGFQISQQQGSATRDLIDCPSLFAQNAGAST